MIIHPSAEFELLNSIKKALTGGRVLFMDNEARPIASYELPEGFAEIKPREGLLFHPFSATIERAAVPLRLVLEDATGVAFCELPIKEGGVEIEGVAPRVGSLISAREIVIKVS